MHKYTYIRIYTFYSLLQLFYYKTVGFLITFFFSLKLDRSTSPKKKRFHGHYDLHYIKPHSIWSPVQILPTQFSESLLWKMPQIFFQFFECSHATVFLFQITLTLSF